MILSKQVIRIIRNAPSASYQKGTHEIRYNPWDEYGEGIRSSIGDARESPGEGVMYQLAGAWRLLSVACRAGVLLHWETQGSTSRTKRRH